MRAVFSDRQNRAVSGFDGLFSVKHMRWGLPGGARDAELVCEGSKVENQLEQIFEGIGYGVDIFDDCGQVVWNGYVNEIEVQIGKVEMRINLDQFANRVAIRYVDLKPSAPWSREDGITGFIEELVQVQRFGKKEWIGYLPNGTPEQAMNAAKSWLKEKSEFKKRLV